MILNGKAKIDFEKWFYKNIDSVGGEGLDDCKDIYLNALIIEFLDSVKIYISINYVNFVNELTSVKGFEAMVTYKHLTTRFREVKNRTEATEKAIEKANEIYNNLNK